MPNVRLLFSIVTEIALIQLPFMVLKGPSNYRNHAIGMPGDKAYNHWDTLEETVKDHKKVEQVWNAFKRALSNQLHFDISETLIWQTSDKTNRRQWLTWISASSRLSGGANRRRKLIKSE